ncbi:MAG TPA: cobalamin-binding protein [Gammaproteobacteria bacterium]|nr:cobalamin-binding protein [Gammaproteobacteria bacterium]
MRASLLASLLVLPLACAAAPVTATDDAGHELHLDGPARRIVSLAPHITELLFAAGAGAQVVGVSEYSDYPPAALTLPRVGSGAGLDLEAIVALRPELVVAWSSGNSHPQLEKLEQLGIPVFYSEPRRIDDIATSLERLGRLAGSEVQARRAAEAFRAGVARLGRAYAGRQPVRVFYQIWQRPLMTVNGRHMISAWLRLCGARNVFSDLPDLAPVIDLEAVLQANPEAIVAGRYPGKGEDWKKMWLAWPQLEAVARHHLFTVPAERMERQTPRSLEAAAELCEKIDSTREGIDEAIKSGPFQGEKRSSEGRDTPHPYGTE